MRSALLLLLLFCALAQAAPVRYQLVSNLTAPAEMLIASEKNPWRDRTLRVGIISENTSLITSSWMTIYTA